MNNAFIGTGTYDQDTTGDLFNSACAQTNFNFAQLFATVPATQQVIYTGRYLNDYSGDSCYTVASKINANFVALFGLTAYAVGPYLINTGSGPFNGVCGTGDPGKLMWLKVDANFAILWGGLIPPLANIGSFIFGQSGFGVDAF